METLEDAKTLEREPITEFSEANQKGTIVKVCDLAWIDALPVSLGGPKLDVRNVTRFVLSMCVASDILCCATF